jgi:FkbM family methyltransferase
MQTAFVSQMRRAGADSDPSRTQAGEPVADDPCSTMQAAVLATTRSLFRRSKPMLRPVASRVRSYLVAPLLQELERTHAEVLQLRRAHAEAAQRTHAEILEIRRAHAETMEELQRRVDRIEQYSLEAARRVAVNCGPGEVLVRTEVGFVLCSAADHAVLAELLEAGEPERGTRLLIQRLVEPGDVFVDVGAHLGLHTLAAARAMNGHGRIVAFEPFAPTQRLLRMSVLLNGFSNVVEIHQAAVSDHSGRAQLFLGMRSGHHSLFPPDLPAGTGDPSVEVPLVGLDDVLKATPTIDLLKIDAEGAEPEVLDGARSLIEHNHEIALIVEFGPSHLRRRGLSARAWLSRFERLGFTHQVIAAHSGCLEDRPLEQLEETASANLLFARPDAHAWRKAQPGLHPS